MEKNPIFLEELMHSWFELINIRSLYLALQNSNHNEQNLVIGFKIRKKKPAEEKLLPNFKRKIRENFKENTRGASENYL